MDFVDTQLFQVIVVLVLATLLFFGAYSLPQKVAGTILIVLIPFQPIETQYASANVVLTWIVFVAMLMKREHVRLPLLPQILLVLFVFFISMGLQHPATYIHHGIYMFNLVTAFLVLWIAYDLTLRFKDPNKILSVFVAMNVLVAIYCVIQLVVGPDIKLAFLGIAEMSMMPVQADYRLTGPFGGVGTIAEYFVIIVFLLVYLILTTKNLVYRRILVLLVVLNLVFLIATGNRGGFLTFVGAAFLYLWLFRRMLGLKRTVGLAVAGIMLFTTSAAIAVNFTQFDRLFDRLIETEIEEGIPDTRQRVWPAAWKEIKTRPIIGHGPRLRFVGEEDGRRYEGHKFIRYPHNLYLSLLFTGGVLGAIAFLNFLITPLLRCWRTSRLENLDVNTLAFAKTGIIIMIVIFVDQIKVEFTRIGLTDYWHFVFAVFGVLVAVCDQAMNAQYDPNRIEAH